MPESPIVEVRLPGFCEKGIAQIRFDQVNTLNSFSLNINTGEANSELLLLPDGLWSIEYKICPYEFIHTKKKHLRITTFNNKLKEVYNKINLYACDSKNMDYLKHQLVNIHMLIEGAKAAANVYPDKAIDYYKSADKLVDNLLKKHCTGCKNEF